MMWSSRRAILVLVSTVLVAVASTLPLAMAQKRAQLGQVMAQPPGAPGAAPLDPDFSEAFSLHKDDPLQRKIVAVVDYINEKNWIVACETLQKLVQLEEDVFVPLMRKGQDGKQIKVWAAVKTEADRLIATLPPEGREFYQATYGDRAATMLKEARVDNDIDKLRQVMNAYIHTEAGIEATNLLGSYYLDRGTYITASRCYEQLLKRESIAKLSAPTLLKAACAFHMGENHALENQVWKELNTRGATITLGTERRTVAELQDFVASLKRAGDRSQSDWPVFGGNPSHNARGEGDNPFLEAAWRQQSWETSETGSKIKAVSEYASGKHLPFLPSAFPIAATINKDGRRIPLVVYRGHGGIVARNVMDGTLAWRGKQSEWSMDGMFTGTTLEGKSSAITSWIDYYMGVKPLMVFENTTIGALSTDGTLVFGVEDLAVPPPPAQINDPRMGGMIQQGMGASYPKKVNDAIQHNQLVAYSLSSGKIMWHVGNHEDKAGGGGELDNSYFLGPPMPIDGKLYALRERQQELQLICLHPATGKLLSSQTLGTTRERLTQDVSRRIQAAHLSYGEGMLVCPTNAGALLGVNLLSNRLVWAYPYREPKTATVQNDDNGNNMVPGGIGFVGGRRGRFNPGMPGMVLGPNGQWVPALTQNSSHWQVTAPIIQDNKVVFTAPDAKGIHCINLSDGANIWTHPRSEDDLFLAGVFNGKVLIVGKRNVRALSLAKGEQLWSLEVGMPSGQGVASDNAYYLPLKEGITSAKEPEVCAIDIDRGVVLSHSKSRKKEVPGNLLFYEGVVLSQTLSDVTAFPQLKIKLAQIDESLRNNPQDPRGLTERGELRLDKGDRQGAVDDLLKALKNNPPPAVALKAKAKLYDALTEYLQHDFKAAEKYIPDYEPLCKVEPAADATEKDKDKAEAEAAKESKHRRVNFLCLVAKGKESQHKLIEAYEKYLEFSDLAGKEELISVIDEPSVRAAPDVWSQGRIRAMVESATPEERKPLEDRIQARWAQINSSNDTEELKKFVAVFGPMFTVGKEARLKLAERLMDDADPMSLLEAERHLSLLRGRDEVPEMAARAVECLARLNTRKGLLRDAAYYYRLLRTQYGKVIVKEGKTGSEIYDEQTTDKRLYEFIDVPDQLGGAGKTIKPTIEKGRFLYNTQTYGLGQNGEPIPFFQENQLTVQHSPQALRAVDPANGEVKWSIPLPPNQFQNLVFANVTPNMPKYSFMNLGHLVVLPLGQILVGIDPINRKVLWEKNLIPQQMGANQQAPSLLADPRDNSTLLVYAGPDSWVQRLGSTGPLEGNVICVQSRDALMGLDPVSGRVLWTRSDVSTHNHIFGDDQTLYIVEMNGDNKATTTRAVRIYDGVSVKVPDFAKLYESRVSQYGHCLLVTDNEKGPGPKPMRVVDIATGKDVWAHTFPANSIELKSEIPYLGGMMEPDGKIKVVNLKTGKEVLNARADPKHLTGVTSVHLLADQQDYYVAINGQPNAQVQQVGGVQSLLVPPSGMRSLPVHGTFYCFKGENGKVRWYHQVQNQMVVLDSFQELPFVLFAGRYAQVLAGQGFTPTAEVRAIQKHNGKMFYKTEPNDIPNGMSFHALQVDVRRGLVDFIGSDMKITFNLNGDEVQK